MKKIIPWEDIEESLSDLFSYYGRQSIPVRQIIGALIIQADKTLSDRDTLITIMETPMLQYFLGLDEFMMSPPFDYTLLCKYRKLIGIDIAKNMIDLLLKHHKIIDQEPEPEETHKGSLSIDATAVPVNITYPTDLKLLNKVREKTEEIIDACHKTSKETIKPRTYRIEARREYLKYAKAKRLSKNKRRTSIRKQLQYIRRNIETIESRIESTVYTLRENHIEAFNICKII
ncbi:MAG TPA: transposase, partial [Candidatus Izemoplasmatales bacterium]|nr:transposase [Candidatus Izemoplasmatales bacterium]